MTEGCTQEQRNNTFMGMRVHRILLTEDLRPEPLLIRLCGIIDGAGSFARPVPVSTHRCPSECLWQTTRMRNHAHRWMFLMNSGREVQNAALCGRFLLKLSRTYLAAGGVRTSVGAAVDVCTVVASIAILHSTAADVHVERTDLQPARWAGRWLPNSCNAQNESLSHQQDRRQQGYDVK